MRCLADDIAEKLGELLDAVLRLATMKIHYGEQHPAGYPETAEIKTIAPKQTWRPTADSLRRWRENPQPGV